jgi:hypothetical protein
MGAQIWQSNFLMGNTFICVPETVNVNILSTYQPQDGNTIMQVSFCLFFFDILTLLYNCVLYTLCFSYVCTFHWFIFTSSYQNDLLKWHQPHDPGFGTGISFLHHPNCPF